MSKHTVGPWNVVVRDHHHCVYDASGNLIADASPFGRDAQTLIDARLIVAAPDLLVELEHLVNAYDTLLAAYGKPFGWGNIETEAARAAIAKAKGE